MLQLFTDYLTITYVQSILVVFGAILTAYIIDLLFTKILHRITQKTKTDLDDRIVTLLHKPIFYSLLLIGLTLAIQIIKLPDPILFTLNGFIKSIAVVVWSIAGFNLLRLILDWSISKKRANKLIQSHTLPLFDNLGKILIIGGTLYFLLLSWDINVTAIIASAGIIAAAIGFAAKDTLANLFAGIFIMADAPYKIGDYVNLDSGERGRVTDIGLRSTRLLTRDDIQITVPNSAIAMAKIINESGGPSENERIRITIGLEYGANISVIKELLINIAKSNSNVLNSPSPRVRFRTFDESQITFQLLCWILRPELRGKVIDELNTKIYNKFQETNIKIPFPQRTVHIINEKDK